MPKESKEYFFKAFLTITLATLLFYGLYKMSGNNIIPKRLFSEAVSADVEIIDSLALEASTQTDSIQPDSLVVDSTKVDSIAPTPTIISSSNNMEGYSNIINFYEKLYQLETTKKGKVRIAYFSDSMCDGDLIVQDVRSIMQDEFGGEGVGFVGITSLSAASRYSINHKYSTNWQTQSFLTCRKPTSPFGIDGQVHFALDSSQHWVRYRANAEPHSEILDNPTFFYGKSSNTNASATITFKVGRKDSTIVQNLSTTNLLNTISLPNIRTKDFKVTLKNAQNIPFYGANFGTSNGVYIDNFSIRGNSGLPLSILDPNLMNSFDNKLHYDLIILHYGTNVLNYGTLDYTWYLKKMTIVVNHLRTCFPHAELLIISSADKSNKINMEMQSSPAVVPLVNSQKQYASNTNSAFLNLYTLMGGNGSMVQWESNGLSNKDYTHFSIKGAKKIASLIYGEINKGYIEYKKLKESGTLEEPKQTTSKPKADTTKLASQDSITVHK